MSRTRGRVPLPDGFSVEVIELDGFTVVSLTGELDSSTVAALKSALAEARTSRVIVDLSGLTFMDSTGLGALVEAHSPVPSGDRSLVVVVPRASVPWRVVELTSLAQIVPVAESLSQALRNELRIANAKRTDSVGDVGGA